MICLWKAKTYSLLNDLSLKKKNVIVAVGYVLNSTKSFFTTYFTVGTPYNSSSSDSFPTLVFGNYKRGFGRLINNFLKNTQRTLKNKARFCSDAKSLGSWSTIRLFTEWLPDRSRFCFLVSFRVSLGTSIFYLIIFCTYLSEWCLKANTAKVMMIQDWCKEIYSEMIGI